MDPNNHHHHHSNHPPSTAAASRAEAERLLGVSEKLLHTRDLSGSREFALLAQETDPSLDGSDQILAITDVLLAGDKRVNNNRHYDWYSILQSDRLSDADLLRKNYRRLALLLHPDKNNFPLSSAAFKLVADAWAVLSDPSKRTPYDHQLSLFAKVDLRHPPPQQQAPPAAAATAAGDKLPVRRSVSVAQAPPHAAAAARGGGGNFWTACPYCYVLYEYPKVYEEYCVRCGNCERAFHAAAIPSLPPMVPGKEAYYCCWGFFPLGFSIESGGGGGGDVGGKGKKFNSNNNNNKTPANNNNNNNVGNNNNNNNNNNANANNNNSENANVNVNAGFPNWMPGMFTTPVAGGSEGMNVKMNNAPNVNKGGASVVDFSGGSGSPAFQNTMPAATAPAPKKRGRPRKTPLGGLNIGK